MILYVRHRRRDASSKATVTATSTNRTADDMIRRMIFFRWARCEDERGESNKQQSNKQWIWYARMLARTHARTHLFSPARSTRFNYEKSRNRRHRKWIEWKIIPFAGIFLLFLLLFFFFYQCSETFACRCLLRIALTVLSGSCSFSLYVFLLFEQVPSPNNSILCM